MGPWAPRPFASVGPQAVPEFTLSSGRTRWREFGTWRNVEQSTFGNLTTSVCGELQQTINDVRFAQRQTVNDDERQRGFQERPDPALAVRAALGDLIDQPSAFGRSSTRVRGCAPIDGACFVSSRLRKVFSAARAESAAAPTGLRSLLEARRGWDDCVPTASHAPARD